LIFELRVRKKTGETETLLKTVLTLTKVVIKNIYKTPRKLRTLIKKEKEKEKEKEKKEKKRKKETKKRI